MSTFYKCNNSVVFPNLHEKKGLKYFLAEQCHFETVDGKYIPETLCSVMLKSCRINTILNIPKTIKILNLSDNYLKQTLDISHLECLEDLDVSKNILTNVILPTKHLVNLNISGNLFRSFNTENNFFEKLKYLDVSYNNIPDIDDIKISSCPLLTDLDISNNQISSYTGFPNNELKCLDISGLGLEEFPYNISKSCKKLFINNNAIQFIPAYVSELTNLVELQLNNNRLNDIEHLPPNIKIFTAKNNYIKSISITFPNSLEKLKLNNNFLSFMPPITHFLQELNITGNEIPQEMVKEVLKTNPSIIIKNFQDKDKGFYVDFTNATTSSSPPPPIQETGPKTIYVNTSAIEHSFPYAHLLKPAPEWWLRANKKNPYYIGLKRAK